MNVLPGRFAVNGASKSSRFRLIRLGILAALALFLVWEVATRSLAAYFADARPETALRLRSTEPTALLNLAEAKVAPVFNPKDQASQVPDSRSNIASAPEAGRSQAGIRDSQVFAEARDWSEQALRNDPLNARAFRILGLLSQDDNEKRTEVLMQAAVHRSLHESAATYWMMQKSYQKQDYPAAIRYADTLLRTRSDVARYVMPILGSIAEKKDASKDLKQLLASNPPWRSDFLDQLPANVSDARTPLEFLLSLKNTPTPPTATDLQGYLRVLIDHKLYELAYYTWLQFLPPAQLSKIGRLFNGDFEVPPSDSPFDWRTQGSGVTFKIAARSDKEGDHALFMNFGGERVGSLDVRQLIWLSPGSYRFQGKEKLDIVSQRGLRWHVSCVNQEATEIGASPLITGHAPTWADFDFSFTVPEAAGCPAQYVWLNFDARWASEQFMSGAVWFDDLQIERQTVDSH